MAFGQTHRGSKSGANTSFSRSSANLGALNVFILVWQLKIALQAHDSPLREIPTRPRVRSGEIAYHSQTGVACDSPVSTTIKGDPCIAPTRNCFRVLILASRKLTALPFVLGSWDRRSW